MPTAGDDGLRSEPGLLRRFAGRLRDNKAGLLRRLALLLGWFALLVVVVGTTVWALRIRSGYHIKVGDVFSLATLVLTFFAGVVALLAYQASTGSPDLRLGIMFHGDEDPYSYKLNYKTSNTRWTELGKWFNAESYFSAPELEGDPDGWAKIAYIWIDNRSKYSARSPAVIVRFGKYGKNVVPAAGLCRSWKTRDALPWKAASFKSSGMVILATQWDGGSEKQIHGNSTRQLPDLPLETLFSNVTDRPVKFDIELLADGYKKIQPITMTFTVEPAPDTDAPLKPRSRWCPWASRPRRTGAQRR